MYYRRMPVYLLLDVSESMVGEAFQNMQEGLDYLVRTLKKDPLALETAYISVITFAAGAKQVVPLSELALFNPPPLKLGSGTALGEALKLLDESISRDIIKNTATTKGDYKPICFILTDGEPTDKWENIASKLKSSKLATLIVMTCGPYANTDNLRKLSDTIITINDEPESIKKLFKWISSSVTVASQKLTTTDGAFTLPELDGSMIELRKEKLNQVDPFVFIHSRCISSTKFYIQRYKKETTSNYSFVKSHPLEDFDFTTLQESMSKQVSTEQLGNGHSCPYCSNDMWAMCSKGHIFCCPQNDYRLKCPWCGSVEDYGYGKFDVGSGRG